VLANPAQAFAPKMTLEMRWQTHPRAYAQTLVSSAQFICLDRLVNLESRWNPMAENRSSRAFGIFQFLPTTWANYHYPTRPKNSIIQVKAGLRYIQKRYGTACNALKFHQRHGWY
jgi:hypothetical protein